jgi:hypothetical protein
MRRVWTALLAPLLLLATTALAGPIYLPQTLDYYFRLEWAVAAGGRGPVLEGYVYNKSNTGVDRMILRIDELDAAGSVVGSKSTWVLGGVPPNNRAWFETRVPQATSYRVEIVSFDWVGRGGGGGM